MAAFSAEAGLFGAAEGAAGLETTPWLRPDTEYGLVAYVFTNDLRRALRVAESIDNGMVCWRPRSPPPRW
ncbi:aldehyde dehydrogenase family protein [Kribbella sp. NPDC026596]|uniref:aldehyde dehydrogenase family protein n=1 Tax=Kribbella sp. NPDC026596 TaxID=3155122 RepID=UPI0033F4B16D